MLLWEECQWHKQLSAESCVTSLAPATEPAVQENGEEGGEGKEVDLSSPKKCDIIIISGRREKCEAAREALQVCNAAGSGWSPTASLTCSCLEAGDFDWQKSERP